jgi:hypothetical protein
MAYFIGSNSRIRADRLMALGWRPLDKDWKLLVEESGRHVRWCERRVLPYIKENKVLVANQI